MVFIRSRHWRSLYLNDGREGAKEGGCEQADVLVGAGRTAGNGRHNLRLQLVSRNRLGQLHQRLSQDGAVMRPLC